MIRPERILVSAAFRGLGEAVEEAAGVFAGERVEPVRLARLDGIARYRALGAEEFGLSSHSWGSRTRFTLSSQCSPLAENERRGDEHPPARSERRTAGMLPSPREPAAPSPLASGGEGSVRSLSCSVFHH